MKLTFKNVFWGLFIGGVTAIGVIGQSDREGAEAELKSKNYTLVEYKGKTDFLDRGPGIVSDKFNVVAPGSNDTTEVIVTMDHLGVRHIAAAPPGK